MFLKTSIDVGPLTVAYSHWTLRGSMCHLQHLCSFEDEKGHAFCHGHAIVMLLMCIFTFESFDTITCVYFYDM